MVPGCFIDYGNLSTERMMENLEETDFQGTPLNLQGKLPICLKKDTWLSVIGFLKYHVFYIK